MAQIACRLFPLLLIGLTQVVRADYMDKLAKKKMCADEECSSLQAISAFVLCCSKEQVSEYPLESRSIKTKLFCLSDVISIGQVVDDYNAPDCRFLNLKEGQLLYVYSKLVREGESGEFWSGSIYSDDEYEDQMGMVAYFPSTLVTEQYVFQNTTMELPTTAIDFYCD
ncbi:otoraplin-like [Mobula birostris]|uniref:otoraplin-like n=1 Tax=Mobula birostris TaxID=1983395 RepID=UPI003B28C89A